MKKNAKFFIFIISIFIFISIFQSCSIVKNESKIFSISKEWNYKFYSCKEKDFSDQVLIKEGTTDLPVNFWYLIKNENKEVPRGVVELSKVIDINVNSFENTKFLGLYLGKLIDCSEIYINDKIVSKNGIYKNKFFTAWNKNILVKIPNYFNENFSRLEIKLKIYYYPNGSVQDEIYFGDYEELKKIERINNLIDIDLKIVFLLVSIFFALVFVYIGFKLKTNYYIYFALLIVQLFIFTLIYVITDLPIDHEIFNYLFEYKSLYLSLILIVLFINEYIKKRLNNFFKFGIFLSFIGFSLDIFIYNRNARLSIYQLFNILMYLIFAYLVFYVIFDYIKTKSKLSKDIIFPMILLFLCLTNDLVAFRYADSIKRLYPKYITLKYLNIYGFQIFVFIVTAKLVKDLVDSFYQLRILTIDLDKISIELEKKREALAENLQKILDETKESFITSEKLTGAGSDFSKFIFNLKNSIKQMQKSLELASNNEQMISEKTSQLTIMLKNVEEGFNNTNKILENVIEKINTIIENTNQIDSIVEQTSLLSLNSSVVAGKAKEKGKGFSIISDEIRKLALKSSSFSSNAHEGIDNILKSVNETKLRSKDFFNTFSKYLSQFNELRRLLDENKNNHDEFNNKINEMNKIVENIGMLADEMEIKAKQLYIIANQTQNIELS